MYKNNTFADKLVNKLKPLLKKWWFWVIVVPPALLVVYGIDYSDKQRRLEQAAEEQKTAEFKHYQDSIKTAILTAKRDKLINDFKQLEISKWGFRLGGLGDNIPLVNITFVNQSNSIQFKDIVVQMLFIGESGTVLNKVQRTINTIVAPNGTKRIKEFSFGFVNSQTKTARIEIINATME